MDVNGSHGDDYTYRPDPDEPPVEAICRAVAAITDCPVLELSPLSEVVDPDAVAGLLADTDDPDRTIQFAYEGCTVVATPDVIRVREQ